MEGRSEGWRVLWVEHIVKECCIWSQRGWARERVQVGGVDKPGNKHYYHVSLGPSRLSGETLRGERIHAPKGVAALTDPRALSHQGLLHHALLGEG
jgi:hypothetical protein